MQIVEIYNDQGSSSNKQRVPPKPKRIPFPDWLGVLGGILLFAITVMRL